MDFTDIIHKYFNYFFLIYGSILFISYILIGVLSSYELNFYTKRNKYFNFSTIQEYKLLPSISIIAPCFNEENTITDNIRSLLALKYPNIEIIIVNDGSTDNTLKTAIDHYKLIKISYNYEGKIKSAPIRGIYKSTDIAYSNLIFIDKENGGKSDALNTGINISRSELFLCIDVDCIIEHDALFRMVKPYIEEEDGKRVIASGGVIRVANSCEVEDGQLKSVKFPTNFWAKFQILEYFRAFILSRMAWSKINGLLIISGALGLFDRKLVLKIGGYDTKTVGEDLELVIRMRRYMHEVEKKPYKVAFIPEPLCWTEVPSTFRTLARQRNRWTRGLIYSLVKHIKMLLNVKYKRMGLLAYPYWILFEWLGPIIEVIGIIYFIIMLSMGRININYVLLFTAFMASFSILYSSFAVFYEKYAFGRYKGVSFMFKIFSISIMEMLFYHPLNMIFSLSGNFDYFFKDKSTKWGNMNRVGFHKKTDKNGK